MKMAGGVVEAAGFWLPSDFLTDDDFLMDKEIFKKRNNTEPDSEFCFPTEFPYDFETQTDHLLQKFWMMSTSPQSPMTYLGSAGGSSNGSPNGVPSPPKTPLGAKYDDVGDLIYLAAGEVAKLKHYGDRSPMVPPRRPAEFYSELETLVPSVYLNTHFQQKQQNESSRMLYGPQEIYRNRGGVPVGRMSAAAWTPRQNPSRGGGQPAKRPTGTGVFLPRRYENLSNSNNAYSSDFQRRPGVQARPNGFAQSQPQLQDGNSWGSGTDYYSLMARKHAVMLQQRRSLLASLAEGSAMVGRDPYLPPGWSY